MRNLACKNIVFGDGRPKICVPIAAENMDELKMRASAVVSCPAAEVVEWRADWYNGIEEEGSVCKVIGVLKEYLGDIPILFTFRSKEEGGQREIDDCQYSRLIQGAAEAGADLVDVELSKGDMLVKELIRTAHKEGLPVIVSSHDFEKTPESDVMMGRLIHMHELGADFCKLAVMPENPLDTLRLLEVTWKLRSLYPDMRLITMSMSEAGSISRVCGEVFGSVLTFGTVGTGSAPGQLDAECLREILDAFHKK